MSRRLVLVVLAQGGVITLGSLPGMAQETVPADPVALAQVIVRPSAVPVAPRRPAPRTVVHVAQARRAQQPVRRRPLPMAPARPGCDSKPGWQQVRGARAVAALGYPLARLSFAVEFRPAHAGYTGLTDAGARRITLFVRSCAQQSDASLLFTYAHEVGHAIDAAHLSAQRHGDWMRARGRAGSVWFGCGGCNDFATGAGDFAETFALWRTGDVGEYHSVFAARPSPEQLKALAPMFDVEY